MTTLHPLLSVLGPTAHPPAASATQESAFPEALTELAPSFGEQPDAGRGGAEPGTARKRAGLGAHLAEHTDAADENLAALAGALLARLAADKMTRPGAGSPRDIAAPGSADPPAAAPITLGELVMPAGERELPVTSVAEMVAAAVAEVLGDGTENAEGAPVAPVGRTTSAERSGPEGAAGALPPLVRATDGDGDSVIPNAGTVSRDADPAITIAAAGLPRETMAQSAAGPRAERDSGESTQPRQGTSDAESAMQRPSRRSDAGPAMQRPSRKSDADPAMQQPLLRAQAEPALPRQARKAQVEPAVELPVSGTAKEAVQTLEDTVREVRTPLHQQVSVVAASAARRAMERVTEREGRAAPAKVLRAERDTPGVRLRQLDPDIQRGRAARSDGGPADARAEEGAVQGEGSKRELADAAARKPAIDLAQVESPVAFPVRATAPPAQPVAAVRSAPVGPAATLQPETLDGPAVPRADWVTVRVESGDGAGARIRVAVIGDRVRATIVHDDPAAAEEIRTRLDDLHQALTRRGFGESRVGVQSAAAVANVDAGSNTRGDRGREDGARQQSAERDVERETDRHREESGRRRGPNKGSSRERER